MSNDLSNPDDRELLARIRASTPARVFRGRVGTSYSTNTHLKLREDHAAARDAVWAEVDVARDLNTAYELLAVQTRVNSKEEYLLRPDLGRRLNDAGEHTLREHGDKDTDVQIVIGDGLSAAAIAAQVPNLLPLLSNGLRDLSLRLGRTIFVRYCRVGILNDIGELLRPEVVILLIGERPGLATAESLSAYLAYRPRPGDTDARRNLISNIHARGIATEEAARRIIALAQRMRELKLSGVEVKESETHLPEASIPAPRLI